MIIFFTFSSQAKTWLVGPDFRFKVPSAAIQMAKDGDTIKIVAGTYQNDYSEINQNNLTIEGMNGLAHLTSQGRVPGGKAIWVVNGQNIILRNIEFSGVKVADKNGAGIRLQKGSLLIENGYFHDNQMGILTSGNPDITLTIRNSEFNQNSLAAQDLPRLGHNIYIGKISEFVLENSTSRGAQFGHGLKTRARKNIIRNNRIFDEGDVGSSYLIDFPNGGIGVIENNYLFKSKAAQNNSLISYGAEGMLYADNSLSIQFNKAINEKGTAFLLKNHSNIKVKIQNNTLTNIPLVEISGIEKDGFWHRIIKKFKTLP